MSLFQNSGNSILKKIFLFTDVLQKHRFANHPYPRIPVVYPQQCKYFSDHQISPFELGTRWAWRVWTPLCNRRPWRFQTWFVRKLAVNFHVASHVLPLCAKTSSPHLSKQRKWSSRTWGLDSVIDGCWRLAKSWWHKITSKELKSHAPSQDRRTPKRWG